MPGAKRDRMRVLMPDTLERAVEMRASEPDAVPIAGGTDLMVDWPQHLDLHDRVFLDLSGIGELKSIVWDERWLSIGALTTYWDILNDWRAGTELSMLQAAARTVGAVQIQTRGTWAGNIANASPAADGVPVLMAYGAEVEMVGRGGARRLPLSGFYHGYKQLEMRSDELITRVWLPRREHRFEEFIKVGPRRAQSITKVGAALACSDGGWRVVANSMAATVCRCPQLERMLDDEIEVRSPADLLDAVRSDVSPIDDIRSTARYRQHVLSNVVYHALRAECAWIH